VPDGLVIRSHKGPYAVHFSDNLLTDCSRLLDGQAHFLVDANVARLYAEQLRTVLQNPNAQIIEATEDNKSIQRVIPVIEQLVENRMRREHTLVAIGGGIIQDITCFIATTYLRGVPWRFVPTTLLAQADSCIGSKSSINLGPTKNVLGTFNPPKEVFLCTALLDTLDIKDIYSGIGEIIKVHVIDGAASFDRLAADYDAMLAERPVLLEYIRRSLLIKQRFIELDEFDQGVRNFFNYGHSFGHAIESATSFGMPHGVAVAMGMDIANRIAVLRGLLPEFHYRRMHGVLRKTYAAFSATPIPFESMRSALMKDKKNTSTRLVLIFPVGEQAVIERVQVAPDETFHAQCEQSLEEIAA
jgi:3-dehydroquinate synthase